MAERRGSRKQQDLTPDELAPPAGERGDALTIVGILGEGADADTVRLFLDVQFQTYYEIPSDAILRRTRVPAERSRLGVDCSAVVVPRGTELVVHRATTRRVEEEFLAGDFTASGTFRPAFAPWVVAPAFTGFTCPPSDFEICATDAITCVPNTGWKECFSQDCPPPDRTPRRVGVPVDSIFCPPSRLGICLTDDLVCPPSSGRCNTLDPRGCPMGGAR